MAVVFAREQSWTILSTHIVCMLSCVCTCCYIITIKKSRNLLEIIVWKSNSLLISFKPGISFIKFIIDSIIIGNPWTKSKNLKNFYDFLYDSLYTSLYGSLHDCLYDCLLTAFMAVFTFFTKVFMVPKVWSLNRH